MSKGNINNDTSKPIQQSRRVDISFLLNSEDSASEDGTTNLPLSPAESTDGSQTETSSMVPNDGPHQAPRTLLNTDNSIHSRGDRARRSSTVYRRSQTSVGNAGNESCSSRSSSCRQRRKDAHQQGVEDTQQTPDNQTTTSTASQTSSCDILIPPSRRVINEVPCDECESLFFNQEAVQRHRRAMHSARPTNGLVRCPECMIVLRSEENLARHSLVHGSGARFECNECSIRFMNKKTRTSHMRIMHGHGSVSRRKNNVSWACPFDGCNYASTQKTNITRHYKKVHLGICEHECPECEYRAGTRTNLGAHMLKHRK